MKCILDDAIKFGNPPVNDLEVTLSGENEVITRGRHVFMGYYNDQTKTRMAFDHEGWFRTGDLGRKLPDGNIVIEGIYLEMVLIFKKWKIFYKNYKK